MRADTSYSIYRRAKAGFFVCFSCTAKLIGAFVFDSTIPLHPKFEIPGLWLSSVTAQPGLCRAWSEALKTGILTTRLIYFIAKINK